MNYTIHRIDTFTFEVRNQAGNVEFRGPMQAAANECSRLNAAAMTVTTSERKSRRLQHLEQKRQAGQR